VNSPSIPFFAGVSPSPFFLINVRKILIAWELLDLVPRASCKILKTRDLNLKILISKNLTRPESLVPDSPSGALRREHDGMFGLWSARADVTRIHYGVWKSLDGGWKWFLRMLLRPFGAPADFCVYTHGLRRGLHSCAAPRLDRLLGSARGAHVKNRG
jgi:hypothetical protein